jgi:RimK family alpha-L-glutamate ligase
MTSRPRIALFVDQPDWHSRRLLKAFAAREADASCVSLGSCGFRTGTGHGLLLPGFDTALPAAAFVRQISDGSFEQVTKRLGVLHALRELGVRVYNDARAAERCVDKSTTSFLLHRAGVPTPDTWAVESPEQAHAIVAAEARPECPLVLKPLFGSQGRGLRLVEGVEALPPPEQVDSVFYLQRYVSGPSAGWRDWRVFVVGGQAIAAMIRHGVEWRTNAARGAHCEAAAATGRLAELAVAATRAVGANYAGVDIIADGAGELQVLEVNSMPAWKSLQSVCETDIAAALAGDLLALLAGGPQARELPPAGYAATAR